MKSPTKKQRLTSVTLKAVSLVAGFGFWYIFGAMQTGTARIAVPLYFYNVPEHATITAPETIMAQISGKRSIIRALNQEAIALHIDAQTLHEGANLLTSDHATIFLPEALKLVHYLPSNPIVELHMHKDHQDI